MKAIKKELDKLVQEASHGKRCRICGQPAVCFHHVVRRDDDMCRYDPVNLMSVCQHCHNEIHAGHINEKQYLSDEEKEFLNDLKKMSYKDFLIFVAQQTEDEYLKGLKKRWKKFCTSD